jgi:hypothetical protein
MPVLTAVETVELPFRESPEAAESTTIVAPPPPGQGADVAPCSVSDDRG